MLKLTSNKQVAKLIKNGVLAVEDDIEICFDGLYIDGDLKCHNIYSKGYIRDINARGITARDINAGDITARDITAGDINAWDINAGNISYHGVCFAYKDINCKSIKGRRDNAKHFCLDGKVMTEPEEKTDSAEDKLIKIKEILG